GTVPWTWPKRAVDRAASSLITLGEPGDADGGSGGCPVEPCPGDCPLDMAETGSRSRDFDFDHVRRAGHVHGGAGGEHDQVTALDEPLAAGGFDGAVPEILDVLRLGKEDRDH